MKKQWVIIIVGLLAVGIAALWLLMANGKRQIPVIQITASNDWPMYMAGPTRNSWAHDEAMNREAAANLRPLWMVQTGSPIVAAPTVVDGAVYVGNWNRGENFFKFDATSGRKLWGIDLGYRDVGTTCDPVGAGVSSGAAVYSGTVYVGGGGNWFYALNANDGAIRWKFNTAFSEDDAYTGNYNWSSPLFYGGAVYVGVASLADCPLVQGRLLKLDAQTGALLGMFKFVPDGHVGGTVWTSPTLDPASATILVTTGNAKSGDDQPLTESLVQLDLDLKQVVSSWRVPSDARMSDTDWGGTPDVFNKNGHNYAATVSKNGKLYIFDTANIAAGPITSTQISAPHDCPQCGASNLVSPAFDERSGRLYVAGPRIRIGDSYYGGTVGAVEPPSYNAFIWRTPTALDPHPPKAITDICEPDRDPSCRRTPGVIIAPVSGVDGVVSVNTTWETQLRDADSGKLLYTSKVITNTAINWLTLYAGSAFADGRMYLPDTAGQLFAYAAGHTRSDDFTDTKLGDQWYTSLVPSDGYSLDNGALHLTAGTQPSLLTQWPLGGDAGAWVMTTTLTGSPAKGGAGLVAWQDKGNYISVTRTYSDAAYIALTSVISGTASTSLLPDDPAKHANISLRLSKTAQGDDLTSRYVAEYSYDGTNWQALPASPAAYFGLLQVGLYVEGGEAAFAELQISPGN